MRYALPLLVGCFLLGFWEAYVAISGIPKFVLPAPSAIGVALFNDAAALAHASWVTLRITAFAFFWAMVSGVGMAILFTRARR